MYSLLILVLKKKNCVNSIYDQYMGKKKVLARHIQQQKKEVLKI